ncbi:MAG TPA: peptide ABC transporter substrate-binding protein, partial [Candidatus Acidoferrales bacterium]|nr:peptide ABC transporter substrate-binding protein [Candidatus Acidoferrales bacterium]
IVSDPHSLNPLFVTAQSDVDISQLYLESLVGLSAKNELIPLLADPVPSRANGGVSPDGMTIVYHLRRGARFADGVPVTSKDVAFTYRATLDPRNPVTSSDPYRRIASLATPDASTVVVRLKYPWVAAVSELFAVSDFIGGILPAHAFASTDISRASWNEHPFGSGPFAVERWRHGDRIELTANTYAWRKPRLSRVVVRVLSDQTTLFVALQTNDIDVATLTEEQIAPARRLPGVNIVETLQNHTIYVEYQTARAPVSDPLVRRALVEAIDREHVRNTVFLGFQPLATTEIPPIFAAHDRSVPPAKFDPAAAAADLERAGWHLRDGVRYKDGKPLQLLFAYISTSVQARRLATIYQEELARVGVDLVVKGYPATAFYGAASSGGIERGGNYDLAYTEWYGGSDPEESEFFTCANLAPAGANTSFWCNHEYDRLFAQQMAEQNVDARRKIFFAMQRVVHDASVGDWLVNTTAYTATSARVRGWAPNMLFMYGNADQWDVSP